MVGTISIYLILVILRGRGIDDFYLAHLTPAVNDFPVRHHAEMDQRMWK
jgi:hypothetical protein